MPNNYYQNQTPQNQGQAPAPNPYANQAPAPNPYANQVSAPNPYANQTSQNQGQVPASNPYANQEPQNPAPAPAQQEPQKRRHSNEDLSYVVGRLASDCRYICAQTDAYGNVTRPAIAYFTVAINKDWVRKDGTQAVDFRKIQASGKLAERYAPKLLKGAKVYVKYEVHQWSTKNEDGSYTENTNLVATEFVVEPVEPKTQTSAPAPQANNPNPAPQNPGYTNPGQPPVPQANYNPAPNGGQYQAPPAPPAPTAAPQVANTPNPAPQNTGYTNPGQPPVPQANYNPAPNGGQYQAPPAPTAAPQVPNTPNPFMASPSQGKAPYEYSNNPFATDSSVEGSAMFNMG